MTGNGLTRLRIRGAGLIAGCLIAFAGGVVAQEKKPAGSGLFDFSARTFGVQDAFPTRAERAKGFLKQAEQAHDSAEWIKAINTATQAILIDPDCRDAYWYRANSYFSKNLYGQAIADWNEVLRLDPKQRFPYVARGQAYCKNRDFTRGLADFEHRLSLGSTDHERANIYLTRATANQDRNQHELAIADLDQTLAITPDDSQALFLRGRSLANLGEHDRAIADLNRSIALSPTTHAFYWRGESQFASGQYADAQLSYQQAITIDPKNVWFHVGRGMARLAQGQVDGSIEDFDRAIALDDSFGSAYTGRGWAYLARREWKKAADEFDQASLKQCSGMLQPVLAWDSSLSRNPLFDQPAAIFQERCRAWPQLRFALIVLIGEEARCARLQNPYFAVYFVRRPSNEPGVRPNLLLEVVAEWRTVPDSTSALAGSTLIALLMRDWQAARVNLGCCLNARVEEKNPGSTRPSWREFINGR